MKYYAIGQDKKVNGTRTGMNSVKRGVLGSEEITEVISVTVYPTDGESNTLFDFPAPKYGDIISGPVSVYSDRICENIKELGLPVIIRPAKLLMYEEGSEEPGYNLVLRVPDVDCMKVGIDVDRQFEIDESLVKGNSFFDLSYGNWKSIRVIDETLKKRFDVLDLCAVYMIPVSELNSARVFHLKS